ncbi:unnamed protein product [marine sediment metagenome]|uniref:Uncharacterized protein n=1 Tax=marine sediment metagenome TaxID=412755 RepID=X1LFN9_9ZZZZ
MFQIIIVFTLFYWGYIVLQSFSDPEPLSRSFWKLWDIVQFLNWSILAPGLIFYIIHYIKKSSARYEKAKIGRYHLHEGFFGIILLIIAYFLSLLVPYLWEFEILREELISIIYAIRIILFLLIFGGSFLIFRDKDDILRLKWLEKKENKSPPNSSGTVFTNLSKEDLHFFKIPKMIFFPFGFILTSLAIDLFVYEDRILPTEYSIVVLLEYASSFLSGGLIGLDWMRLFKIYYPELYNEIIVALDNLKNEENEI